MSRTYQILHRSLAPLMMATPEEEAPSQALPEGVTQVGGTMRATPVPAPVEDPGLKALQEAEAKAAPKEEARPEGLPEGFDSWQAYAESLAAKEAPKEEPVKEAPKELTPTEKAAQVEAAVSQTLEGVSEDMRPKVEPFVKAFAETGTLTDAQVKEAAAATGFSEAIVRQFMAGAETEALRGQVQTFEAAQQQAAANKPILDVFGGEEKWTAFAEWSVEGLTEDQHKAFNSVAQSDPGAALELAKTYKALYDAAGNDTPKDITRKVTTAGADGAGFKDEQEYKAAMGDPRYSLHNATGEAYRQTVYERLAKSDLL